MDNRRYRNLVIVIGLAAVVAALFFVSTLVRLPKEGAAVAAGLAVMLAGAIRSYLPEPKNEKKP